MPVRRSTARATALLAMLAFATPAAATAAERHATPVGGLVSGDCGVLAPCTLKHAVEAAGGGDEVIVGTGNHPVAEAIVATEPLAIRGEAGQPRPRLLGDRSLIAPVLSLKAGGSIRYLAIEAAGDDALGLRDTLGEDLLLSSSAEDAAKLTGAPGVTVLRDSVAISTSSIPGAAALKLRDGSAADPGDVVLVNVSAYASAGDGIRCETTLGESSLVNVAVRGALNDIAAAGAGVRCPSSHSAYRRQRSPGKVPGSGDRGEDPRFADPGAGDLHLLDDSLLADAGSAHPLLGAADPDGLDRLGTGTAPAIGAYEGTRPAPVVAPAPTPAASSGAAPVPAPAASPSPAAPRPAPQLGRAVVLEPAAGTVRFRAPGARAFTVLDGSRVVPTGAEIDARRGTVRLQSALTGGATQTGHFRGAIFRVRQSRTGRGMTELHLSGRELARCPRVASSSRLASASRARPKRRLWASDKGGRFRTHGAHSIATARGTAWLTEDSCAGTLTRVSEGAVLVRRPGGRDVLVRAGRQRMVLVRGRRPATP